jgi:hypothetical protein
VAEFDPLPEYFFPLPADALDGKYAGWKAVHVRHEPGAKTKFHWELENPDLQRVKMAPDGKGGSKHGLPAEVKAILPLYGGGGRPVAEVLNEARISYSENTPFFVCEGERDVETLETLGKLAVCSPHGGTPGKDLGKKWPDRYTEQLQGLTVVVIADHDETGLPFAQHVAAELGAQVRCPPGVGDDLTDHVITKENESSWIFEPRLTCTNALRRVQNPGSSLVSGSSAASRGRRGGSIC